ncbi:MAG: hypothetical protein LBP30_08895, partial [Clostridiales Family XIII bacterium]|nr:hypothetical protein [Clostridiales Family XIII bacterium]
GGIAAVFDVKDGSDGSSASITVENCRNDGDVSASVSGDFGFSGGIVASFAAGDDSSASITIENCRNNGDVSASVSTGHSFAGGILGYGIGEAATGEAVTIRNCIVACDAIVSANEGGKEAYAHVISYVNATKSNNGAKQGIAGDPVNDANYAFDDTAETFGALR